MNEQTDAKQFLTFHLSGEEFGISILKVKEILEFEAITAVPGTPSWIRGVINLRGSVVPVVDLARKFGGIASEVTKRTCIVIVEVSRDGEQTVMGVIADAVSQVVDLASHDIEPPPSFGTRVRVDYLLGMGKLGNRFALLLDIDRILTTEELLNTAGIGESASANSEALAV